MKFEFTDYDIRIIEKLTKYNLKEDTKNDIMSFLTKYKFKKKFYSAIGKYVKIKNSVPNDKKYQIIFLFINSIQNKISDISPFEIKTDQCIIYYFEDGNKSYSKVATMSKEGIKDGRFITIDVLISNIYEVEEITRSQFDDELFKAININ